MTMKIAVFCQAGICRSAAMANVLKTQYGHDALNAGLGYNSEETIRMLGDWADRIVVMQKELLPLVPRELRSKTVVADVGPDIWKNSSDPDLVRRSALIASQWAQEGWKMADSFALRPR
jgi:predicted protein tyrosine phosphatase